MKPFIIFNPTSDSRAQARSSEGLFEGKNKKQSADLAREHIQNELDACLDPSKPVKLKVYY